MTDSMHRILVVEDDLAICAVLQTLFEGDGFRTVAVGTCRDAISFAQLQRPDVCIVDLGLPDMDGLRFIEEVRTWSAVPIIVLTARTQEPQRLAAFEAGADDYIIKPFSGLELIARLRAITRRLARRNRPEAVLHLGSVEVNLETRETRGPEGKVLKLTPLEHRILECLVQHAGALVTHEQIMNEVWGPQLADLRSLRVYVASLRRKLERDPAQPQYILTEVGVGYRLVSDGE
ncbi:MAG TPA: response regulator transcription factor [Steroidobacteraceae bacterium]|jgi:two-component system KDP operon response regulator KdpE|nr:response regulator transcription factor [Steroidobacteraceae bacterium]